MIFALPDFLDRASPPMHEQHGSSRMMMRLLLGVAALALAGWASADPPSRIARLSYISGAVSFSPAGDNDWVLATVNRPLITGDRLWVDAGARAELQIGSAVIRMNSSTSVTLLNLEDRVAQIRLAQGTLNVRVRRLGPNEVFEIATPNLAYSMRRPGEYRIDVDPSADATTVVVRDGQAEVYGEDAAYTIEAQQSYRFFGTALRDYEYLEGLRADEFDRWSSARDRRESNSVSARYVSRDVIGYEDLDEYGTWRAAEGYGNVWIPSRVPSGWAPYREGHWVWVEPWGWTWVDDAPWGFAVSHYGRWAYLSGSWCWVPGPIRARPVYAPALVAFVGGSNFQIAISTGTIGAVAWFALGPRDVYRPAYPVSRTYFHNINTSNTTINTTTITNVYNSTNVTNITYVNQQVPGAIVAVPRTAFVQSQPVAKATVQVPKDVSAKAPVTAVAAVAPLQSSVRGPTAAGGRPPAAALARPVVAREPPPAPPVPFAAKQSALAANPGKPLDAAALAAVKPATAPQAPSVKVVKPAKPATAPAKQRTAGPRPPEAQERPQAPEVQRGRQPPPAAPRPPEAQERPQPPEAQKGRQPPPGVPRPPEPQERSQPPEAQKGRQPPPAAPRPPEAQERPQPPEAQKGRQPPPGVPRAPEAQVRPQSAPPTVERRAPEPKPQAVKPTEKREEQKGDEKREKPRKQEE
jgi:hypothetical protein